MFCNLVGGQDELVFDGYSLVVDQDGELMARGAQFEEELIVCDIDPSTAEAARLRDARHRPAARMRRPAVADLGRLAAPARHDATEVGGPRAKPLEPDAEVYEALCLGLRDYVEKNGFERRAAGALGRDRLRADRHASRSTRSARTGCACAVMPSPHSSDGDAAATRARWPTTSGSSASSSRSSR